MRVSEEKIHPEFGKLLSKPDISSDKAIFRVVGLIVVLLSVPMMSLFPEVFADFHEYHVILKAVSLCGVALISLSVLFGIACYFRSIFLNLEIFEMGYINAQYQTWKWKLVHVRSYEVTNDILLGITESGEKREIIRRGSGQSNQNVFDNILHDLKIVTNAKFEPAHEEDYDIIMKFSNWAEGIPMSILSFCCFSLLIYVYFEDQHFDWISLSISTLILGYVLWSFGSIEHLSDPWNGLKTCMISDNQICITPNSLQNRKNIVELASITKVVEKKTYFSRSLILHYPQDGEKWTSGIRISQIWNDQKKIEKLFREVKMRIPSDIFEKSQG